MPLPGEELSSIDFESMIGGPLVAVVNAQAQSALSTINFIKTVGFKQPPKDEIGSDGGNSGTADPIYVSFEYPKETAPYIPAVLADTSVDPPIVAADAIPAKYEDHKLRVPILTMLPIPYIRIEETTVDFNAKINSVTYRKTDTTLKVDAEFEAKYGNPFTGSVRLKVNVSYQRNTQQGNTVNRTFSLAIHVRAVQDEMPAGMEKILSILEDAIVSKPSGTTDALHPVDRA